MQAEYDLGADLFSQGVYIIPLTLILVVLIDSLMQNIPVFKIVFIYC